MKSPSVWQVCLYWIIFDITALLIGSISVQWQNVPNLPNIISFALGFASLILAIIAIIQSLQSNTGLSASLQDISRASENILRSTAGLEIASRTMSDNAANLPIVLGEMSSKIDIATNKWSNLNDQDQTSRTSDAKTEASKFKDIGKTTFGGYIALYVCLRAYESGKSFTCLDIFDAESGNYYNGFISGMRTAKFLDSDISDGKFTIKSLGEFSEDYLKEYIDGIPKRRKDALQKRKDIIDSYFSDET